MGGAFCASGIEQVYGHAMASERWHYTTRHPVTTVERMLDIYRQQNRTLDDVQLGVLVDAVRDVIADQRAIMAAMLQIKRRWPELRDALNAIDQVTNGRLTPRKHERKHGGPG